MGAWYETSITQEGIEKRERAIKTAVQRRTLYGVTFKEVISDWFGSIGLAESRML
jgi:hypothetical protein